ncbi:hypothetical protein TKK_0014439 [Trichogramma kaykai]
MAPLSDCCVKPARLFEVSGVDFAGPFAIQASKVRGSSTYVKAYICIFVRMLTKAVHIEVVTGLTTDDNIVINNSQERNCIIILNNQTEAFKYIEASYNRLFLFDFMRCLRFKCKPGTSPLWGGEVLLMTTSNCDIDRKFLAWSVALEISGTAMKSWSIVLKSKLSTLDAHDNLIV